MEEMTIQEPVAYFDGLWKKVEPSQAFKFIVNNLRRSQLASLPNPALPPVTITTFDDKSGISESANLLLGGEVFGH